VEDGDDDADEVYCRMYILGDVLDDYRLRSAAMERLIDGIKCTAQPSLYTVWDVYERTPTGSPLRKFLVDRWIGRGDMRSSLVTRSCILWSSCRSWRYLSPVGLRPLL
jgi:hypothetical protein